MTKVGGPTNNSVPIETITSFKRMRHFKPLSAVVAALKESSLLDVVDDDAAIKRKTPLDLPPDWEERQAAGTIEKVFEDAAMARSVYVKGFGAEKADTQFQLEAWFEQFGSTNQVRLRRFPDQTFKGSAFAEFDSEETQKAFLAADPPPKYGFRDLIIKSNKQYCDEKVDEINN